MSTIHRTLKGQWEICQARTSCSSPFHFEMSLVEAQSLPEIFIEQLAESFDPPVETEGGERGPKLWYNADNQMHRDYDLPALIAPDDTRSWWQRGKYHRDFDKPAMTQPSGLRSWYQHGVLHRDNDQPAIIKPNGYMEWWVDGKLLRANGNPMLKVPGEPYEAEDLKAPPG